jgi:hypothetical protein
MLALVAALATTGIMLALGADSVEDAHEVLAYALLAVIVLHLIGVFLHTLRHRENITMSMLDGLKDIAPAESIPSSRPLMAVAFLLIVGSWGVALISRYDSATRIATLPILGTKLSLGEEGSQQESPAGEMDDDDD